MAYRMPLEDGTELTSQQAKAAGWKRCCVHKVFEPVASFGSDKSRADGLQPSCRIGLAQKRDVAYERAYRKQHAKRFAMLNAEWFKKNIPGGRTEYDRARRQANLTKFRERERELRRADPGAHVAKVRKRQLAEQQAMPSWADELAIKRIYQECAEASARTGVKHHVDHIIPVQGQNVCGLHVHWNLRIIPAAANLRKSNRLLDVAA